MRRLPNPVALALAVLCACSRQPPSPTVFQPTLAAAAVVAQQRYAGDLVVFLSDDTSTSRMAREQVFGPTPLGQFLAANFAAVEMPVTSPAANEVRARYHVADGRPRIIIASDRLEHLRIHIVRLDHINQPNVLRQLKAIKASKTIADFRRTAR